MAAGPYMRSRPVSGFFNIACGGAFCKLKVETHPYPQPQKTSFPNSSGREMNHMVSRPQAAPYLNSNLKVQSFPPAIHPLNQLVIFSPLHIVGMQQMMGQMSIGFTQIFAVELHQIRVLMGFAQHLALILTVESV